MSEFGETVKVGIDVRYTGDETRFDPVSYTDELIELNEKPEFNEKEVVDDDTILLVKPVFQDKIVSKARNYVQDYFELRAQPGRNIGGSVPIGPEPVYPAIILFTRENGVVTQIDKITAFGTKITNFTRVNDVVTEIDVNDYDDSLSKIAFTRSDGVVTRIDITDL